MGLLLLFLLLALNLLNSDGYLETVVPEELKTFNKSSNPLDSQLRLLTVMNLMQQANF
jgi:hypothetical protein